MTNIMTPEIFAETYARLFTHNEDHRALIARVLDPAWRPEGPSDIFAVLCALQEAVASNQGSRQEVGFPATPADCFCGDGGPLGPWEHRGNTVRYMVSAVLERIDWDRNRFKGCMVEFCQEEATIEGNFTWRATSGGEVERVDAALCAEHFNALVGDSLDNLKIDEGRS